MTSIFKGQPTPQNKAFSESKDWSSKGSRFTLSRFYLSFSKKIIIKLFQLVNFLPSPETNKSSQARLGENGWLRVELASMICSIFLLGKWQLVGP